jgi:hypothetical protein
MTYQNLPNEILNIIFSFRENHPTAKIMKPIINDYNKSDDNGDYYFTFQQWTFENLLEEKLNKSKYIIKEAEDQHNIDIYMNREYDYGDCFYVNDDNIKSIDFYINHIKKIETAEWHYHSRKFRIKEGLATYIKVKGIDLDDDSDDELF